MSLISIKDVVDHFGSQRKTAAALNITQPTVNHMVSTGQVSVEIALLIQKITEGKFSALELRPSLRKNFTEVTVA